ncbi:MAG TPA: enoyl-CoA hydratase [Hyphomicrobiaceae bacterium]|nr:enoyl-CoA hydratase [Hyphomicrobiaceae bacterium]
MAARQAARTTQAHRAGGSELEVERRGAVLVLTLARPERRNSLSEAMLAALQAAIDGAGEDAGVRAIVITAKGPAFCAGHDLKELTSHRQDADGGKAYFELLMRQCAKLMRSIVRCPKPVIAAVQGTAQAAGCQLVATCDLAVAAEEATFCTPGVNIGLFCSTPMVALSRNVSRKRAMEMLLLGELLAAKDAAEYGLVNRVVAAGRLIDEAMALAQKIATKPPVTLAIGKEAFYRQVEMGLGDAYDYAAGVMVENMMHGESKEGIGAFIEKRPPVWDKS